MKNVTQMLFRGYRLSIDIKISILLQCYSRLSHSNSDTSFDSFFFFAFFMRQKLKMIKILSLTFILCHSKINIFEKFLSFAIQSFVILKRLPLNFIHQILRSYFKIIILLFSNGNTIKFMYFKKNWCFQKFCNYHVFICDNFIKKLI